VFITAGIREMQDLKFDLTFEVIGQGRYGAAIGFNEVLMAGPTGVPIGRMWVKVCSKELYEKWYLPLKMENVQRIQEAGGFEDGIDSESYEKDVEVLLQFVRDHEYRPRTIDDWIAYQFKKELKPLIKGSNTTPYRRMIANMARQEYLLGKVDEGEEIGVLPVPELRAYNKDLENGFQFDENEEVKTLQNDLDQGIATAALFYYDQMVNGLKYDDIAKKHNTSLGNVSKYIGYRAGKPCEKLMSLFGKINLGMAKQHEDYVQQKWELFGFEPFKEIEGLKRDNEVAAKGLPDRVMMKPATEINDGEANSIIVGISCKASNVDRDIPVLKMGDKNLGEHTGMEPEIDFWNRLRKRDKISYPNSFIALEYANVHPEKREETTIIFGSPDEIPNRMNAETRRELAKQNHDLLAQLVHGDE